MIVEPSGTFGEQQHTGAEDNGGEHLQTPWNSERLWPLKVRAPESDEVLDEDTPGDRPLLERDHAATDGGRGELGLVHRNDGGGDSDGDTGDDTTDDEHTAVHGCALEDGADDPDEAGKDDGLLATDAIGEEGDDESAAKGAGGHRSDDGTLSIWTRLNFKGTVSTLKLQRDKERVLTLPYCSAYALFCSERITIDQ